MISEKDAITAEPQANILLPASDEALANAYSLLSRCFSYPDTVFHASFVDGSLTEAFGFVFKSLHATGQISDESLDVAGEALFDVDAYRKKGQDLYHEVRVEYTGLFIGLPNPRVSPYESIHSGQIEGRETLLFVDRSTQDALRAYKMAGLTHASTTEPPDHIAIELEFSYYLLASGHREAYRAFSTEHLKKWMPKLSQEVIESTSNPFFQGIARLLKIVVEIR